MHDKYNSTDILPPVPDGLVVKYGNLYSNTSGYSQPFVSGGFFLKDSPNRTFANLGKSAILSLDIDGCDCPAVQQKLGLTVRKEVKHKLYAMTETEILDLFNEVDFVGWATGLCVADGLPGNPNRILYTGHGIQFFYWLSDDLGWSCKVKPDSAFPPARLKEALRQYVNQAAPVHIDDSAKDIGTRLVPLVGYGHRNSPNKKVRLLPGSHDVAHDLRGWFESLEAKYPSTRKAKRARAKATPRVTGPAAQGVWSRRVWLKTYPELDEGERDTCPVCGGSGYKRMPDHYACFSCRTHFVIPPKVEQPVNGVRKIHLDKNGHMILPPQRPDFLVLKTATASGKTRLLEEYAGKHKLGWFRMKKVLAICPYISLAEQLAFRLKISWASADSDVSLRTDSVAMCLASMPAKANVTRKHDLQHLCLVIDESETVLGQVMSMLNNKGKDVECYNQLLNMALFAEKIVLCDQNAGPATQRFIDDVNRLRGEQELTARDFEYWVSEHYRHSFLEVQPVTRLNKRGESVVVTSADEIHKGIILSQLEDDKKVAIYGWGPDACRGLARLIRARFPTRSVRCVVGSKSRDSKNDLSQAGLTADVLIYNNAMSTGVSYDIPDHYDFVHVLAGNNSKLSGDVVEQAAHRIRKPGSKDIFISGANREVINDWRCDWKAQLAHAQKLLDREEAVAKAIMKDDTFTLRSDYMVSSDAKRVANLQAIVLASEYQRGKGWALNYLRTRHRFTAYTATAADDDIGRAHRQAVEQVKYDEATDVATAVPLSERDLERVNQQGADTDAEADSAQATRMTNYYGDAYSTATVADKADLVLAHKKGLFKKVDVFAQARCFDDVDEARNSIKRLKKANKNKTEVTAVLTLNKAVLFRLLLDAVGALPSNTGTETQVTAQDALTLVQALRGYAKMAGLNLRRDWQANPLQQVGAWLKLGGLAWDVRQVGPRGARTRQYFLTQRHMSYMTALSQARYEDIRQAETAIPNATFSFVA